MLTFLLAAFNPLTELTSVFIRPPTELPMPKINLRKGLLVLANLAGFGAATSLFPWEFSTVLCHCMSLLEGGVVTGPDVAGGKTTPDVKALPVLAETSKRGKSSLLSPRPCNNVTVMGPKRGFRAGREILREDKKKQSRQLDSSNSPLTHSRGENIRTGEELPR